MQKKYCIQCGALLEPGESLCTDCKANLGQKETNSGASKALDAAPEKSVRLVGRLRGNKIPAAAMPGEMIFIQPLPAVGGLDPGAELGPLKCLLSGVWRIIKDLKTVFKDKKRLALVGAISCVWLVLLILPALGVNYSALKWLNFLTFAQGGAIGGTLGLVGGLIGKGLLTYFFSILLLPFFNGGRPFVEVGNGLKRFIDSFAVKDRSTLLPLLGGLGLALAFYNFLTVNNSLQNSMAGIAACLLGLRALANEGGFLRRFLFSLTIKPGKGQKANAPAITRFMAGWVAGFALGVPFSLTSISMIGYLTGIVVIIVAVILNFMFNKKKEVPAG